MSEFYKNTPCKGGHIHQCKECRKKKSWYNPPNKKKIWDKTYRDNNKELVRKRAREWARKWRKENPQLALERDKTYQVRYRKQRALYNREYTKRRKKTDIKFKLRRYMSSMIASRLRQRLASKNGERGLKYLNYNIPELIIHLEKDFQLGMTWKNYGKWHIDHIIPDSHFNYKSVYDVGFQKSWSLDNLQPLWAVDNLKKGKKKCVVQSVIQK